MKKPRPPARNTSGGVNQDHLRGLPLGEQTKTSREDYLRGSKPRPPARITSGEANQDHPRGLPPGEQTKTSREDYLRGSKPRSPARNTSGGGESSRQSSFSTQRLALSTSTEGPKQENENKKQRSSPAETGEGRACSKIKAIDHPSS